MNEKQWQTYDMTVNGLPQKIRYNADTVEGLFLPLLRRLTEMQRKAASSCFLLRRPRRANLPSFNFSRS